MRRVDATPRTASAPGINRCPPGARPRRQRRCLTLPRASRATTAEIADDRRTARGGAAGVAPWRLPPRGRSRSPCTLPAAVLGVRAAFASPRRVRHPWAGAAARGRVVGFRKPERTEATTRRGAASRLRPLRVGWGLAGWAYVNLNFAVWLVPSLSVTVSWRQVPAHALSVFQTYLYWSLAAS
jgi:hypothetical protein